MRESCERPLVSALQEFLFQDRLAPDRQRILVSLMQESPLRKTLSQRGYKKNCFFAGECQSKKQESSLRRKFFPERRELRSRRATFPQQHAEIPCSNCGKFGSFDFVAIGPGLESAL